MTERIGQQFGHYRLERLLGTGGFAQVYLGTHVHVGSPAAVKLVLAPLATAQEIAKFRTEAQTIAALQHPHIVRLLDFGVEEGMPYLVLDYAPNGSLRQHFPPGSPLPPATILPAVLQVASALQYAHEQKLVHRDVKPENLLLGRNHDVLLTDFGIATVAQTTSQQQTEGVAGTAAYMAPEQLQGKPRPASDLYALGVVVYEWLCGERPFQGGPIEVATQQVLTPPPPLREKVPDLPEAIEQVVLTALAKDPKDRFGSVRAFANAFQQACGEAGSAYLLSTQAVLPLTPSPVPALPQTSQGDAPGATPAQAEASIFSATTHVTPQLTLSLSSAETHLIVPASVPGADSGEVTTPGSPELTVPSTTPPALGWAAPQTATGSDTVLPATAETAYQAGGPPATSDEHTLADAPGVPGAPVPQAGTRQGKGNARRWALVVAACLVVLALIGGGGVYGLPLLMHAGSKAHTGTPTIPAATGATVTITPSSSDLKNTFALTGVTGTPDASQQQVGARVISVNTPAQTRTVTATGQQTTPGMHATGTVQVANYDGQNSLTLAAGTTYPNSLGCGPGSLIIVLDAPVNLQAGGSGAIPAHVSQIGTIGNFDNSCSSGYGFLYIDQGPCPTSLYPSRQCWAMNSYNAFTGGTDPQTYSVVAQSDIDGAANSLISANQPDAQQVIQGQLQSGEAQVGTPQCSSNVNANHNAGDQASQVTVTVSFTCAGKAYDHDGALALAQQLLTSQATTTPGAGYTLVGQIKTTLVSATPGDQGTVAIVVQAEGIWVYQFTDAQKQALATLIAGKSQQEAMSVLAAQTGVAQARIQITGGNGQTLPTDPTRITITILAVSGV